MYLLKLIALLKVLSDILILHINMKELLNEQKELILQDTLDIMMLMPIILAAKFIEEMEGSLDYLKKIYTALLLHMKIRFMPY